MKATSSTSPPTRATTLCACCAGSRSGSRRPRTKQAAERIVDTPLLLSFGIRDLAMSPARSLRNKGLWLKYLLLKDLAGARTPILQGTRWNWGYPPASSRRMVYWNHRLSGMPPCKVFRIKDLSLKYSGIRSYVPLSLRMRLVSRKVLESLRLHASVPKHGLDAGY